MSAIISFLLNHENKAKRKGWAKKEQNKTIKSFSKKRGITENDKENENVKKTKKTKKKNIQLQEKWLRK